MSKTPEEFYRLYNGRALDYDGVWGLQCVDGVKYLFQYLGVPVKATPNNWADGYWTCLNADGKVNYDIKKWQEEYFDRIEDYHNFRDGDIVVWGRCPSHESTHVAMYYKGMEFGERQGLNRNGFSLKGTVFTDALGALRWKGWSDRMMVIEKGFHQLNYNGISVNIGRATAANGYKLHLISAEDNKDVPLSYARKKLMEFDSDRLGIVFAVNANYHRSDNGMHLGCEGDGWVNGYFQAPKEAGIISYYITKDGQVGAHDQSSFYLGQEDIQMVCAPYSVLIHHGQNVNIHSESFGNKDLVPNTQTAILRIQDDWCLATFSKCYPSDVHAFAQEVGADELALMDSGDSTQMFECSTTGHRRAVIDTGRPLSCVLVLAKEIETNMKEESEVHSPDHPTIPAADSLPDFPTSEQSNAEDSGASTDSEVESNPPASSPAVVEEDKEQEEPRNEIAGLLGMSNRTYDILKWICLTCVPALVLFLTAIATDINSEMLMRIIKYISGFAAMVGTWLGFSSVEYAKNKRKAGDSNDDDS